MGHSQASKQQTHERILQIAAKRFCERGIEGVSIADLMKEAGLTHGGFYKHFGSREELVAEALGVALERSKKTAPEADASFAGLIRAYLSEQHRDAVGSGCAVGALINDMGRAEGDARALYTAQLRENLESLAQRLKTSTCSGQAEAMVAYSAMIGALSLSRAIDDPALSRAVLVNVRDYLLKAFAPDSMAGNEPV